LKKKIVVLICLLSLLFVACGNNNAQEIEVLSAEEGDTLAGEFEISYDKIEYMPNVIVNQFGYEVESQKHVFFVGEELAETFQVYEQGSDLLIYEGNIEDTTEEGYGIGEFSDLKQEGEFYIQTKKIGESFPFTIEAERKYDQIYRILIANYSGQETSRYTDISTLLELFPILVAHEMYPTAFFDGDIYDVPNGIPVLDYQYEVANLLLEEEATEVKDLFLEAAFFGKLSFAMDLYDKDIASELKKEANRLYSQAEVILRNNPEQGDYYKEAYLAATESYRNNGGYGYKTECQMYADEISSHDLEKSLVFYADMTLMSTRRSVDVTFCNARMEALRTHIVDWNKAFGTNLFFYPEKDMNILMNHGMEVAWILSLDYNEEYDNFLREVIDYYTGLNMEGLSYIPEIGYTVSEETLIENVEMNNKYLILICKYMQQEIQE
jgi:hypothetical protein